MTKEEREDAINFFKEVAKREVGTYCKLAIEALESKEKSEYDHNIMKAYNNRQAYILDILRKELELIGANEQETNGKTDYLKGITTCIDIIDKYDKTESTETRVKNTIKPIIINPFETEKERHDFLLMKVINTAISVCGYSGDDAASYSIETLKQLGRYDLLPPCER